MMTPQHLTTENVHTPPASLEDGLDELNLINEHVQQEPKLDQLPLLVERTLFLKQYLENGLLAVEEKMQQITAAPTPANDVTVPSATSSREPTAA